MTEPRVVRGSIDQGIEGWHLAPCAFCPDGRIYVENGSSEPAKCKACRDTEGRETPTMAKRNGKGHEAKEGTAHAAAMADGGKNIGPRFSDRLPVPIEGEELAAASTEFAKLYRQRENAIEERRNDNARHKKTLDGIDEQMKPLAETVENHTRQADIECQDVLCRDQTVRCFRLDTGEQVGDVKAADTLDLAEADGAGEGSELNA